MSTLTTPAHLLDPDDIPWSELMQALIPPEKTKMPTSTAPTLPIEVKLISPVFYDTYGLPVPATPGSATLDLRAALIEPEVLLPNETLLIPTGLAIHIANPGYAALIVPRSGLGHCHGIVLGNLIGTIDSDYQGELKISCWNRSNDSFHIRPGDRIAQLMFVPIAHPTFTVVQDFTQTVHRSDSFIGTGR